MTLPVLGAAEPPCVLRVAARWASHVRECATVGGWGFGIGSFAASKGTVPFSLPRESGQSPEGARRIGRDSVQMQSCGGAARGSRAGQARTWITVVRMTAHSSDFAPSWTIKMGMASIVIVVPVNVKLAKERDFRRVLAMTVPAGEETAKSIEGLTFRR